MPWQWVEPEFFLSHRGVKIYHAYKDEYSDISLEFWYSTSSSAGYSYEFDVRDLPGYRSPIEADKMLSHRIVIEAAIDAGILQSEKPFDVDSHA